MHGRLKVKTTEEQEEAKRIERLKKQKLYQGATAKIFAKRAAGEYDIEALQLTAGVLSKNPDIYTLWNFRKEIFEYLHKSLPTEKISALYKDELTFLEACLGYNPKSYGSWEHRCYVMLHTPCPDWDRELSLCTKFLTYDDRNFHCWDYRRFVIKQSNVKSEDELTFTFEKIANNFSNYSSWHYRSKLLPQLSSADTTHSSGLHQSTLLEEMELVQNAFFTDPNDQSAWFYHRWLLGRVENPLELLRVCKQGDNITVLTFSMPVQIVGTLNADSVDEPCNWMSPSSSTFSPVWYTSTAETCTSVKVGYKMEEYTFEIKNTVNEGKSMELYFRHEMTAAASDLLLQELDSCEQLFELEPENKWVLLTIVLLMKSLDPSKYKDNIMSNLEKLTQVDPLRQNYYLDLRNRFIWEEAVTDVLTAHVRLNKRQLTRVYHTQLLHSITVLDLSHNQLLGTSGLNYLQRLASLNLSNNRIVCCRGLLNMHSLVHLNLQNNSIENKKAIDDIQQTCTALRELLAEGNPLST